MRKTLIISIVAMLSIALSCGFADAGVTGRCDGCHTMHYSQNGGVPPGAEAGGPWPVLLLGSCMGCHGDSTSTNTIKGAGVNNIPVVWNAGQVTTDPGTSQGFSGAAYNLAGGNFNYVGATATPATDDPKGHNIEDMYLTDSHIGLTPPGYNATHDPSTVGYDNTVMLTCAGSNGCHGDRDVDRGSYGSSFEASFAGVSGAHHGDDSTIDGTTVARSYRFLEGILGLEDSDWQQSANDANDHNEYQSAANRATANTISYLCGHCHGDFHDDVGSGASPWLRHPTDEDVMGKGGEYANYNDVDAIGNYSLEAPVGYVGAIPGAPRATVAVANSPVICLSCHRAHGSPNDDILRWDYETMQAGGAGASGTGCFTCHTTKD
jgi:predicted CXXCH cytochrome family protein